MGWQAAQNHCQGGPLRRDKGDLERRVRERFDGIDTMLEGLGAYLTSFTTGDANIRVVCNSGTDSLEAWRRLINEYDPTSSMHFEHGSKPQQVQVS